jgi:transcriptional regulator with XRE-family HTH domain
VPNNSLSRTLRDLRTQTGLSTTAAARAAGLSQPVVSRVETGTQVATEAQIRALLKVYGDALRELSRTAVPEAAARAVETLEALPRLRRSLVATAHDLRADSTAARIALHRGAAWTLQARIGRIEEDSRLVRGFETLIVPGLYQTEGYMRAVFASRVEMTPEDLEQAVTARMSRQRILSTDREVCYLVPEALALWCGGSAEVMAAQLDYLAEVAAVGRRLGVIPRNRPMGLFPMHGFHIYDAREVIVGTWTGTSFITQPGDVADYIGLWVHLADAAVYGPEAAAVFERAAAAYRKR